jgi:threonine dehydrogenase-like Zn-dependent dehydrogenase
VGSVLPATIDAAAMGGRVVLFGMNGTARPQVPQVAIVQKGLNILGSYISNFTFPAAIRLIENGLDVGSLVTDVVPLAEAPAAIERLRSGAGLKYIVTP